MKQLRTRLTYANVMSSLAVFLILGGATAFAATKIGANELKANSIITGKIKKEAVTTAKIKNGAISTSKLANDAVTGEKANEATFGQVPSAANATNAGNATTAEGPVAFAHVAANGTVLDARGMSRVAGSDGNYYCFTGISFAPRGIQATADYWNGSPQFNTMVQAGLASSGGLGGTGCPAGTQAFVHGTRADNDAPSVAAFYVVVFK